MKDVHEFREALKVDRCVCVWLLSSNMNSPFPKSLTLPLRLTNVHFSNKEDCKSIKRNTKVELCHVD